MGLRTLFLFSLLLLIASCSIEKRHYRKGYHIEWSHWAGESAVDGRLDASSPDAVVLEKSENETDLPIQLEYDADLNDSIISPSNSLKCDTLYNVKDEKFIIKALRIDSLKLSYFNCDNPTGDTLSIKLKRVDKIVYANGTIDYYKYPKPQGYANVRESVDKNRASVFQLQRMNKKSKKVTNPFLAFAVFLMFTSIASLFSPGAFILVFGSIFLSLIKAREVSKKDSNKYSGGSAIVGFSILAVLLIILSFYLPTIL